MFKFFKYFKQNLDEKNKWKAEGRTQANKDFSDKINVLSKSQDRAIQTIYKSHDKELKSFQKRIENIQKKHSKAIEKVQTNYNNQLKTMEKKYSKMIDYTNSLATSLRAFLEETKKLANGLSNIFATNKEKENEVIRILSEFKARSNDLNIINDTLNKQMEKANKLLSSIPGFDDNNSEKNDNDNSKTLKIFKNRKTG